MKAMEEERQRREKLEEEKRKEEERRLELEEEERKRLEAEEKYVACRWITSVSLLELHELRAEC